MYGRFDHNTKKEQHMSDRYYEPEDDNSDDFLKERIAELMNTKQYDPSLVHHLSEAISEANADDQETIQDHITNKAWDKLGMKLFCMSHAYMEKYAEQQAIHEYNQGLIHD